MTGSPAVLVETNFIKEKLSSALARSKTLLVDLTKYESIGSPPRKTLSPSLNPHSSPSPLNTTTSPTTTVTTQTEISIPTPHNNTSSPTSYHSQLNNTSTQIPLRNLPGANNNNGINNNNTNHNNNSTNKQTPVGNNENNNNNNKSSTYNNYNSNRNKLNNNNKINNNTDRNNSIKKHDNSLSKNATEINNSAHKYKRNNENTNNTHKTNNNNKIISTNKLQTATAKRAPLLRKSTSSQSLRDDTERSNGSDREEFPIVDNKSGGRDGADYIGNGDKNKHPHHSSNNKTQRLSSLKNDEQGGAMEPITQELTLRNQVSGGTIQEKGTRKRERTVNDVQTKTEIQLNAPSIEQEEEAQLRLPHEDLQESGPLPSTKSNLGESEFEECARVLGLNEKKRAKWAEAIVTYRQQAEELEHSKEALEKELDNHRKIVKGVEEAIEELTQKEDVLLNEMIKEPDGPQMKAHKTEIVQLSHSMRLLQEEESRMTFALSEIEASSTGSVALSSEANEQHVVLLDIKIADLKQQLVSQTSEYKKLKHVYSLVKNEKTKEEQAEIKLRQKVESEYMMLTETYNNEEKEEEAGRRSLDDIQISLMEQQCASLKKRYETESRDYNAKINELAEEISQYEALRSIVEEDMLNEEDSSGVNVGKGHGVAMFVSSKDEIAELNSMIAGGGERLLFVRQQKIRYIQEWISQKKESTNKKDLMEQKERRKLREEHVLKEKKEHKKRVADLERGLREITSRIMKKEQDFGMKVVKFHDELRSFEIKINDMEKNVQQLESEKRHIEDVVKKNQLLSKKQVLEAKIDKLRVEIEKHKVELGTLKDTEIQEQKKKMKSTTGLQNLEAKTKLRIKQAKRTQKMKEITGDMKKIQQEIQKVRTHVQKLEGEHDRMSETNQTLLDKMELLKENY